MKKIIKNIYSIIPLKKQLFIFIKLFFTPSKRIYKHLYFKGNIKVDIDRTKSFKIRHYGYQLENEIFWNGIKNGWEKVSVSIWIELCLNSKVVFDIGANTGLYALLAKAITPNCSVFAFEPVERVYNKLVKNNQLNFYNINCERKAISNFDGVATIYDKDTDHIYSVTVNKDISNDPKNSIPVDIETIRLDTFIENNKLSEIDLLKIDVETHEVEVLEGLGKYLKIFEPTLIIEILNDDVAKGIENLIKDIKYDYYVIDEDSGIKQVKTLRKSDYYNFLICKPDVSKGLKTIKKFKAIYNHI